MKDPLRHAAGSSTSRLRSWLHGTLLTPRARDEDGRRREYVLDILLLGSVAATLALDATVLYRALAHGDAYQEISFAAFSVLPLFFGLLYLASRRGYHVLASYLFVGAYLVATSYAAWRWGVRLPSAALGYGLVIFIAGILVSTRFALAVTAAVASYLIPLWHFQFSGQLPVQQQRPNGTDAAVFVVIYLIIVSVSWLSNRELERSLRRARASEAALAEERDLLDIRVRERTEELRAAQLEQVDQLYRFAEFGRLASGLFHDLANMLSAVTLASRQRPDAAAAEAAEAQVARFMRSVRKQLQSQDALEQFSLAESVEQVIQLLGYKARVAQVSITLDDASDGITHVGSPLRFHQVVLNLVQNAIDAYPPRRPGDGPRTVRVRIATDSPGHARVTVSDDGPGIPASLRERVFEPFFTTKDDGMGIGLATARRIAERDFGGTLRLMPGESGSTFAFSFPVRRA